MTNYKMTLISMEFISNFDGSCLTSGNIMLTFKGPFKSIIKIPDLDEFDVEWEIGKEYSFKMEVMENGKKI